MKYEPPPHYFVHRTNDIWLRWAMLATFLEFLATLHFKLAKFDEKFIYKLVEETILFKEIDRKISRPFYHGHFL